MYFVFFFFNDTATTEIYTLSLTRRSSDLSLGSILRSTGKTASLVGGRATGILRPSGLRAVARKKERSEEHTSELQSRPHLVCRLLLEKKKTISKYVVRLQQAVDTQMMTRR